MNSYDPTLYPSTSNASSSSNPSSSATSYNNRYAESVASTSTSASTSASVQSRSKKPARSALDIINAASRHTKPVTPQPNYAKDTEAKRVWCTATWSNLSLQARKVGMAEQWFDPDTGLLEREGMNGKGRGREIWGMLVSLLLSLLSAILRHFDPAFEGVFARRYDRQL
jgi:hypothetical protein